MKIKGLKKMIVEKLLGTKLNQVELFNVLTNTLQDINRKKLLLYLVEE